MTFVELPTFTTADCPFVAVGGLFDISGFIDSLGDFFGGDIAAFFSTSSFDFGDTGFLSGDDGFEVTVFFSTSSFGAATVASFDFGDTGFIDSRGDFLGDDGFGI